MPIVFVHGVNVRAGPAYSADVNVRDEYFRGLANRTGTRGAIALSNPYWGCAGVEFRWGLASLPNSRYEAFGAQDDDLELRALVDEVATDVTADADGNVLVPLARRSPVAAVDALWIAVMHVDEGVDSPLAARLGERAAALAASDARAKWAETARSDDELVDNLLDELDAGELEAFGAADIGRRVKKAVRSLGHAVTSVPIAAVRRGLNETATQFIGDVLQYFDTRGLHGAEGPIETIVAGSIRAADRARSAADAELIVVAHSMGGNVAYDVLTYFAPEVRCDVFVTVGSQVSLFEEMKKFRSSDNMLPNARQTRVGKPANVGRWLNVFDRIDPFAFVASPVFAGVEDYEFVSSAAPLAAHASYFCRPDFFNRLRSRLTRVEI